MDDEYNLHHDRYFDDEPEGPSLPPFVSVSVYLMDQRYGGPEEGGWYYTAGDPEVGPFMDFPRNHPEFGDMRLPRLFPYEEREFALRYRDALGELCDQFLNEGRPSTSSVLSRGRYIAQLDDGMWESFPKERPHYE